MEGVACHNAMEVDEETRLTPEILFHALGHLDRRCIPTLRSIHSCLHNYLTFIDRNLLHIARLSAVGTVDCMGGDVALPHGPEHCTAAPPSTLLGMHAG